MQSPRFQSLTTRFAAPSGLRTSFSSSSRRSQRSTSSSSTRSSIVSSASHLSPVETINSVIIRQPSIVNLEEERKSCGPEQMGILEPRPIVYWGSVEERMAIF